MVAVATVHGSACRITGKAALERRGLDPLVQLEAWIERRAAGAVCDNLDGLEEAAPADIADVPVIAEALGQSQLEIAAEILDPFQQSVFNDNPLHFERRRASDWVREIGMSVLEGP